MVSNNKQAEQDLEAKELKAKKKLEDLERRNGTMVKVKEEMAKQAFIQKKRAKQGADLDKRKEAAHLSYMNQMLALDDEAGQMALVDFLEDEQEFDVQLERMEIDLSDTKWTEYVKR